MGKKIKNKDLAARLGVSCTLVSLVLNNKADQHGIRKDTQEKVLALARQMGYFDTTENRDEIYPVEEKPGVIGMIVPSAQDQFIFEISPYLQKAFSSIGIGFSVITKDPDDQRFARLISSFRKFYSGLIIVGEAADEYTVRTLRNIDYPFVLLEKNFSRLRLNAVSSDINAGNEMVTNHIAKLGYKNILIISDPNSRSADEQVLSGLMKSLSSINGVGRPENIEIRALAPDDEIDFSAIERFLRPPGSVQVIILLHAGTVYPLMAALQRRKIRVPQDVAIISMEEGIGFNLLCCPVTTLKKPFSGLALKTANMIWSEVKNGGKGKYKRQVNLPPEMIIRNSCGTIV
ncbi:MAG TPA: LacI family DNA-binding transcriptional regulator [Bacteroidales bacterium]|nr:LacI family DNA-binding transcriptional regulator [Bacteroidales bacterium]